MSRRRRVARVRRVSPSAARRARGRRAASSRRSARGSCTTTRRSSATTRFSADGRRSRACGVRRTGPPRANDVGLYRPLHVALLALVVESRRRVTAAVSSLRDRAAPDRRRGRSGDCSASPSGGSPRSSARSGSRRTPLHVETVASVGEQLRAARRAVHDGARRGDRARRDGRGRGARMGDGAPRRLRSPWPPCCRRSRDCSRCRSPR